MDSFILFAIVAGLFTVLMIPVAQSQGRQLSTPYHIDPIASDPLLRDLLRRGRKADAMNRYCQLTQTDLAEAKNAIEQIEREL